MGARVWQRRRVISALQLSVGRSIERLVRGFDCLFTGGFMPTADTTVRTMTRDSRRTADEDAIRGVIDAITDAVRARDVDAMLAHCAPELATFDMVPPLKHEGAEAIRRLWAKTLPSFEPPLQYDVHQLEIAVGGDVAFSRSLNRFGGSTKSTEGDSGAPRKNLQAKGQPRALALRTGGNAHDLLRYSDRLLRDTRGDARCL
jgi:ketosteroid isomerase-like protein